MNAKIDINFMTTYFNTVKNGSEYVNIISNGPAMAIYVENKEIFYMSIMPSIFDENVSLRLPVETCNMFILPGTLTINSNDGKLYLTHTEFDNTKTVSAVIADGYCNLKDRIIELLDINPEKTVVMKSDVFSRALLLTKASSKSVGIKGVQFKNNYAFAVANGYIAYMKEPTGLNMVLNNSVLKALSSFTKSADSCEFSLVKGYHMCTVGNLTMGWRKERVQDMYDISKIEYQYTTSLNIRNIKAVLYNIKSGIISARINFNDASLSIRTEIGLYNVDLNIPKDENIGEFNLNINLFKDLFLSLTDEIDLKITGTTLAIVNNGIYYFMGGCK